MLGYEGVGLSMLSRDEVKVTMGAIMSTTLTILDRSTAVAFKALGGCTTDYRRPTVTCQSLVVMNDGSYRLRMSRSDGL